VTSPVSKGVRRINTILQEIPRAREQLLVAMDEFAPNFDEAVFVSCAQSSDARERNKVAVIEREYEVLLNWLHELAARTLAEGQRIGVVEKCTGHPWRRLAELEVISGRTAARLQEAREMRDDLGHAYPPANWRALHAGVGVLLAELDRYIIRLEHWADAEGILGESDSATGA
jgi:hypothetical protein